MKNNKSFWITINHFIQSHQFGLVLVSIVILASVTRLFHLDSYPPSPYWEEAALGYDAYSLLKTGQDHHGHPWPIIAFESFGDWKPSLYFYAAMPSIAIFGLNVQAVRLPAAVAGIGMVVLMGLLPIALYRSNLFESFSKLSINWVKKLGLWLAFLMALEPWAVLFSRAAWEANLATFLLLLGVTLWLWSFSVLTKKSILLILLAATAFGLAMYTYHSARLIAPLLLLYFESWRWFSAYQQSRSKVTWKFVITKSVIAIGLLLLIASPLLLSLGNPEVSGRFATENIFTDISIIEESNRFKEIANNSILSRLLFHRYLLFTREIVANYTTYFSISFLFNTGEENMRHSTGFTGMLFWSEAFFLSVGLLALIRRHRKLLVFLTGWLLIAILPATLTTVNPHALRTLPSLPIWIFVAGMGVLTTQNWLQWQINELHILKKSFKQIAQSFITVALVGLFLIQFSIFAHYYIMIYPKLHATEWWQYGYEQLYKKINQLVTNPEYRDLPIYITRQRGRPAMYDWFFSKTEPSLVQLAEASAKKDQSEFLEFGNRQYIRGLGEVNQFPGILAVSPEEWEVYQANSDKSSRMIGEVNGLDGKMVWYIYLIQN